MAFAVVASIASVTAVTFVPRMASAEGEEPSAPAPSAAPAPKPKALVKVAPKPREPEAPPPSIALMIATAPFPQPWTMRLENTGDVPLRVLADANLLRLEVTPDGAKKSTFCALPAAMRSAGDSARALVLPPKRAYAETFDPRAFCFGEGEAAALVSGSQIVAHLGFPAPAGARVAASGPFVAMPIAGVEPRVMAAKEIVAAPVSIANDLARPSPAPSAESADADAGAETPAPPPPFTASATPFLDVDTGSNVELAVSVTNDGPSAARVRLRPAAIAFDIRHGADSTTCTWPEAPGAPIRELVTTLAPKSRTTTWVLLSALCPSATFDEPGLYEIIPRVDAGRLVGQPADMTAQLAPKHSTFLRVHRGDAGTARPRPKLQAP